MKYRGANVPFCVNWLIISILQFCYMISMQTINEYAISKARLEDLQEILLLQHLAYQSEAALLDNYDIPPLKQTLDEVIGEYHKGIILKMVDADGLIIGSIRAREMKGTVHVGKLMVPPRPQAARIWH